MTPTVVYLTPSSRLLGARRSLLQLVRRLDPARYRPVVVAQCRGALVAALREAGVETRVVRLGRWRKGKYFLARPLHVARLARVAREERADLIHCNEFYPTPYAVRAARRVGGIPVVSHMRLSITERQVRNYDLRRAERVVCVSNAAARDFEVWPDRRERVEVIHNGVDLEEFRSRAGRAEARRRLGLSDGDFVAGQFGLIDQRKRQHLTLSAAARLKDRLPRLRVLIVGSAGRSGGDYERRLRETIERDGLGDVVRMIPFTKDVIELYEACDVNLLVSNDEGFGRTIIEAGGLGVPSIGTRVGGIPELIEDGETGRLIAADDDGTELAESLFALGSDHEACLVLGQSARRHVEAHFSIQRHAERIMDLYDRLLRNRTNDG